MNKQGPSASSAVGDTLQYFEAGKTNNKRSKCEKSPSSASGSGKGRTVAGGVPPRKSMSRTASSNALLRPRFPGLDPSALFSVAAMATAPVGTTVIEDEDPYPDIDPAVQAEWLEMKASIEAATAKAERERKGEGDDDLCDQCYKKRQERQRKLKQIRKTSSSTDFFSSTAKTAMSSEAVTRQKPTATTPTSTSQTTTG